MGSVALRTAADIGALVKARRRALGLRQDELANRIGASRLWVNQLERGKAGAGLALVLRTLAALDIELVGAERRTAAEMVGVTPGTDPDINAIIANARRKAPS